MAERRMFAKSIVDSDAFLEMPMSARLLYYDLGMRADDDGFNNSPRKIMRITGATTDDLNILIARKFIIPFDNGVVVIKHWRIHNYIRKDTYNETKYKEQKALLEYDENNAYRMIADGETPLLDAPQTSRGRAVDEPLTQDRLGKGSLGKGSEDKEPQKRFVKPTLDEIKAYCQERGNNVDAKAFFDYYETGNWKDAKGKPVRNWKQKVITWERSDGNGKSGHSKVDFEPYPDEY